MTNEKLGKILKQRRKSLNLSTVKMAEYTGLSKTTISDIELGKVNPRFDILKNILDILDLEIEIKNR
jgi:transcriptional regulator with XRE-family HTH domain